MIVKFFKNKQICNQIYNLKAHDSETYFQLEKLQPRCLKESY